MMYGVMLPPVLQALPPPEPVLKAIPLNVPSTMDTRMLRRGRNRKRRASPPKQRLLLPHPPPRPLEYPPLEAFPRVVSPTVSEHNSSAEICRVVSPTLSEQHSNSGDVCPVCSDVVPEVSWIFIACVGRSACAQCCPHGDCPYCGSRCGEDEALLRANADKKEPNCCFELGQRFIVKGEPRLAAAYLERAAHLGHTEAAFRLAFFLETGANGFPKKPKTALTFYEMSAQRGHVASQIFLDELKTSLAAI